jgi:5-formyltetrahydrofolate cyclo-ligase
VACRDPIVRRRQFVLVDEAAEEVVAFDATGALLGRGGGVLDRTDRRFS